MIKRIRHKGLDRFYRSGDTKGINAQFAPKLRILLTALDVASEPGQMNQLPGTRLHRLTGDRQNQWSMWVSGNWRLVFEFDGEDATNLDFVDYH